MQQFLKVLAVPLRRTWLGDDSCGMSAFSSPRPRSSTSRLAVWTVVTLHSIDATCSYRSMVTSSTTIVNYENAHTQL